MSTELEISAIVPVTQNPDDTPEVAGEIRTLASDYIENLRSTKKSFEILFIVDGDKPRIFDALRELALQEKCLRILKFAKAFGDATAIAAGFRNSKGSIILTLPAHYQIEPDSIAQLIESLDDCDMVVGCRREASENQGFRRRAFHWLVRVLSGESFSDLGCAARVFTRKVLEEIPLYGAHHIFLPLLASKQGFRIKEVTISQPARDRLRGRYAARFYLQRMLDVFTIVFLVRFTKKPIRFFGMIGSVTFVFGMVVLSFVVGERLFFGTPLADRPALLVSSLLTVLGLQIFALGLLGELIIFTHARDMKEYTIEKIVN